MVSTSELIPPNRPSSIRSSGTFARLLAQARTGSPTSLGELLESARRYLLTVAEQKLDGDLRGKLGASDLVQDSFVEAQRDFVQFRGTTERELLAWLSAALVHRFLNSVRHDRATQKRWLAREFSAEASQIILRGLASQMPTPRTDLVAQEELHQLRVAFDRLPPAVREILVMRIWNRTTFAEIGEQCNCTTEAARKRFFRAVEELRSVLQQPGVG